MVLENERLTRAAEVPLVGGLPDALGIWAARLTPKLGQIISGLADELLVQIFPGSTLSRAERESIATAVSAKNNCFF